MTALSLLRQAVGLLTRQPLTTVTVVAPALALMIGLGVAIAVIAPEVFTNTSAASGSIMPSHVVLLVAFTLSYSLMAILWHRHTLKEVGTLRPFSPVLFFQYMWRVVMLTILQTTISIAAIVPILLANQNSDQAAPAFLSIVLTTFVRQLLLIWLSLRVSLILPAAAIGRPITVLQSWRLTNAFARPLWSVAAVLAVLNTCITTVRPGFDLAPTVQTILFYLPVYIVEGMLIFSILTLLYISQVVRRSDKL